MAVTDFDRGEWGHAGLAPACTLRVFGMRRSGNHAVIAWLLRNAPGTGTVFLNNCVKGRDALRSARSLEVNGTRRPLARGAQAQFADAGAAPAVVISYEDTVPPGRGEAPATRRLSDAAFGGELLIHRGFLNWSASLLAKLQRNAAYTALGRMRVMLRAVETYAAALERLAEGGLHGICFDRWAGSRAYRAERLEALGLPARDLGLGPVQRYGGGSSFQPDAARVEELALSGRAAGMADDPEYRMVLDLACREPALISVLERHYPQDALDLNELGRDGLAAPLARPVIAAAEEFPAQTGA